MARGEGEEKGGRGGGGGGGGGRLRSALRPRGKRKGKKEKKEKKKRKQGDQLAWGKGLGKRDSFLSPPLLLVHSSFSHTGGYSFWEGGEGKRKKKKKKEKKEEPWTIERPTPIPFFFARPPLLYSLKQGETGKGKKGGKEKEKKRKTKNEETASLTLISRRWSSCLGSIVKRGEQEERKGKRKKKGKKRVPLIRKFTNIGIPFARDFRRFCSRIMRKLKKKNKKRKKGRRGEKKRRKGKGSWTKRRRIKFIFHSPSFASS